MAFNRKSLTIKSELKRNPHGEEYYPNKRGLKRFLAGYFMKKTEKIM
ncbi:hypothetical protein PTE_00158 [Photorhabdus khanii NC19]|uniref:Uncharacterized protein n=1 Tax=Photorhabdus khanii NC19 TaxID=1004151 RepID=W3VAR5_9GAMM|nr:hypothetical protein [Photorhabdus khanii]ETS33011.1 hypothetical protein PTE_00158 [Photorhabdus khanii NC19]